MNYSNDSRKKAEQHNKSKAKQVKRKGKVTAFRIIVMSLIIGMFAVVGAGLGVFIGIIKSAPDPSTINIRPQGNYTSFVFDDSGKNQIASFAPADNREYAPLSEIPLNLQNAVIATEDERFYEHNGIDIKGIFRAIVSNIQHRSFNEGASTITQQLIKNNALTSEKKLTRKIQEQYLAIQIEKLYSKEEILEYYLNTIGLSQGVSGVQAAARRYFNKDVSDLSLTECVVLAVITQRPTYYDPIKNRDNNWDKVQVVLQKMEEQGYITAEEHAAALLEDPYINIQAAHQDFLSKKIRPYFVDALFNQLMDDLMALNYTETEAKTMIYGGGLTIYSTMNEEMQSIADKYILDPAQYPEALYKVQIDYSVSGKRADGTPIEEHVYNVILDNDDDIEPYIEQKKAEWGITANDNIIENLIKQPQPQAAFVLMDYATGQIKALCGGRGEKSNLSFNYATQAKRQPGSTFKVLAAYAPAIDNGLLAPDSSLVNEKVTYKLSNGQTYSPKNWDGNYSGVYTVRQAIANSMNVLAVKASVDIATIDTCYDYLLRFGFTTLSETDKVHSLALGGITQGVTPLELNAAYGAIANDGVYVKPVYYTKVVAPNGDVIIDNTGANITNNSHIVIKPNTARMLTDMMREVVDGPSPHTGGKIRSYFPASVMPVAGKTGTTTDNVDLVFAGYTPYYVGTIWTGYSMSQTPVNGANNYHLKIWGEIMNEIHQVQGLPYVNFTKPDMSAVSSDFSNVKICKVSGKLATEACEKAGEVQNAYLPKGQVPSDVCHVHEIVKMCKESGKIANEYCPEDQCTTQVITKDDKHGSTPEKEVCDIHGPDEVIDNPLIPNDPLNPFPDDPFGGSEPSIPSQPDDPGTVQPPSEPEQPIQPEPSLPPQVDEVPPTVDDEDSFAIPQF